MSDTKIEEVVSSYTSKYSTQSNKIKFLESPSHSKYEKRILKSSEFLKRRISESWNTRISRKRKDCKDGSIERLKPVDKTEDIVLSFYNTACSIVHTKESHEHKEKIYNEIADCKEYSKEVNALNNKMQDSSKDNVKESDCIAEVEKINNSLNDLEEDTNKTNANSIKVPDNPKQNSSTLEIKDLMKQRPLQKIIEFDNLSARRNLGSTLQRTQDSKLIDDTELVPNKLIYNNQEALLKDNQPEEPRKLEQERFECRYNEELAHSSLSEIAEESISNISERMPDELKDAYKTKQSSKLTEEEIERILASCLATKSKNEVNFFIDPTEFAINPNKSNEKKLIQHNKDNDVIRDYLKVIITRSSKD